MTPRYARRLQTAASLIGSPSLLRCKRRGGEIAFYQMLTMPWVRSLNIATVLDIGAHVGGFAVTAHAALPTAQVYSFEPLPDSYATLCSRMQGAPNFKAIQTALGRESGEMEFDQNAFSASSSFLPMLEKHKQLFPATRESRKVTVKIARLDDIALSHQFAAPLLVKMDVQGYEDRVMDGGEQTLRRSRLAIIETSFDALYEGQALFPDIYRRMTEWGFSYVGAMDQSYDTHTGQVLQADSVFMKLA